MKLQIRRGLETNRTSYTPSEGELLYSTDGKSVFIGDGTTAGGNKISISDTERTKIANSVIGIGVSRIIVSTTVPEDLSETDLWINPNDVPIRSVNSFLPDEFGNVEITMLDCGVF